MPPSSPQFDENCRPFYPVGFNVSDSHNAALLVHPTVPACPLLRLAHLQLCTPLAPLLLSLWPLVPTVLCCWCLACRACPVRCASPARCSCMQAFELTTMAATGQKADVDKVFREAAAMGMTAARTWAHSISQKFPFQTAPGEHRTQRGGATEQTADRGAWAVSDLVAQIAMGASGARVLAKQAKTHRSRSPQQRLLTHRSRLCSSAVSQRATAAGQSSSLLTSLLPPCCWRSFFAACLS